MVYKFGCARELYQRNIHPRILCGPEDIERLRKRVHDGPGRLIMESMRRLLRPRVRKVLESKDLGALLDFRAGAYLSDAWSIAASIHDIAMMGVLDDDSEAIEAARLVLLDRSPGSSGGLVWSGIGLLAYDLLYDRLSPADRKAMIDLAAAVARKHIHDGQRILFRHAGGNKAIQRHVVVALMCLLAIEGEPAVGDLAEEWRLAIKYLEAVLHAALGVDGYPEEDIGYGTDHAAVVAWVVEGVRRAGRYDAYDPIRGCPHWSRFGRAILHFVQPWGEYLSMTGDHMNIFWNREFCLARLAAETDDPSVRWLWGAIEHTGKGFTNPILSAAHIEVPLGQGFQTPATALSLLMLDELEKPVVHPVRAGIPTAFRDRTRGIVSFRSAWNDEATYVVFEGSQRSPSAQGHFHANCGHFNLTALGEYFGVAPGRYGMEQDQHNLVLVDGKSARSTHGKWVQTTWHGNLTGYTPGDFCDTAAVDSSHQHDCFWARRHLGLVKGSGANAYVWTVEDINKADDYREFWWTLNTSPENIIALRAEGATITGWRKGHHLDVHFGLPDPTTFPKPHTLEMAQDEVTTSSYEYIANPKGQVEDYVRPAAMVNGILFFRPRLVAKVSGYNGRFMSLMLPRREGEAAAQVERLPAIDNVLAVRITFDTVFDTLIWSYEHHLLEADDVEARGQWCVVRRDRRDGRVLNHAIGQGTFIQVAGERLAHTPSAAGDSPTV